MILSGRSIFFVVAVVIIGVVAKGFILMRVDRAHCDFGGWRVVREVVRICILKFLMVVAGG